MFLKNIVYRIERSVIRVTWADAKNIDIVKLAYKTDKDEVISNSLFADKDKILDAKIMFLLKNGEYGYLLIESDVDLPSVVVNQANDNANIAVQKNNMNAISYKYSKYIVESNLSNERCGFCHVLAKHNGSPSGLFFPRYQEKLSTITEDIHVSKIFNSAGFVIKQPQEGVLLGLPLMQEQFLYKKISTFDGGRLYNNADRMFIQTSFETPELIEVMARDINSKPLI